MKALLHLNKYFLRYKWRLLIGFLFVTVSVIFRVFPAQLVRESFDVVEIAIKEYQSGEISNLDLLRTQLFWFGLAIIGSALLSGVFMFFMRQTVIVVSRYIEYDLKNEIFEHYQKLSLSFYRKNSTGDLMNRISEDVSRVRMYVGPAIMYAVNVFFTLVIVIAIMISINARLTFFVLFPLPFLSFAIYKISQTINKRSEKVQRTLSEISTFVQEAFSGIRVLKAHTKESHFQSEFKNLSNNYKDVNEGLFKVNALFFPMMLLLIGLSTLITIYVGGIEAISGDISAGNIAEFILYVNMLTWPVASIGWVTSIVQRAEASQERINQFLVEVPEISSPKNAIQSFSNSIEFKSVGFTYPETGIVALKNVNFQLPEGKTLAIVGRTGSGKSTLANLLLRFYDINTGDILIGGKSIQSLDLSILRKKIGYVPQDAFLFSESLSHNIGFTMNEPNESQVEEFAKDAEVHSNIVEFQEGYKTKIGERGITLSGGQKQRVSIARALAHNPQILLFDDCLSAVDTETEESILQNLKRLSAQRTTVLISHRVSTVKHADLILVLNKGEVVETGTHNDLLASEGEYYKLYQKQIRESGIEI